MQSDWIYVGPFSCGFPYFSLNPDKLHPIYKSRRSGFGFRKLYQGRTRTAKRLAINVPRGWKRKDPSKRQVLARGRGSPMIALDPPPPITGFAGEFMNMGGRRLEKSALNYYTVRQEL